MLISTSGGADLASRKLTRSLEPGNRRPRGELVQTFVAQRSAGPRPRRRPFRACFKNIFKLR